MIWCCCCVVWCEAEAEAAELVAVKRKGYLHRPVVLWRLCDAWWQQFQSIVCSFSIVCKYTNCSFCSALSALHYRGWYRQSKPTCNTTQSGCEIEITVFSVFTYIGSVQDSRSQSMQCCWKMERCCLKLKSETEHSTRPALVNPYHGHGQRKRISSHCILCCSFVVDGCCLNVAAVESGGWCGIWPGDDSMILVQEDAFSLV